MYKLLTWINGIPQLNHSGYHDKDDAFRKVNELWAQRYALFGALGLPASQGTIKFEIVGQDGGGSQHAEILEEIGRRPEFRQPPKVY